MYHTEAHFTHWSALIFLPRVFEKGQV